ncbi:ATP-binding protein [Rhodococcus sp. Eu-32]|uniref:ATP-binding protein n=1 Tax=Rhodococcus sp. Eu-32 TaxID=1017319 RepID=UPI001FB40AFE|nr:ATP-binding protein [Rhodococcus sp. Eu-32]
MKVTALGGDDTPLDAATGQLLSPGRGDVMHLNFDGEAAAPDRASALRVALGEWLTGLEVDPERVYDVVLATYEALANAVEHAYQQDGATGTLDLHALYAPETGRIEVTICDHGVWSVHAPDATRGRGVPLMHALADSTTVTSDHDGTVVRMVWGAPQSA